MLAPCELAARFITPLQVGHGGYWPLISITSPGSSGYCCTARASVCVARTDRGNPSAASSGVMSPLTSVPDHHLAAAGHRHRCSMRSFPRAESAPALSRNAIGAFVKEGQLLVTSWGLFCASVSIGGHPRREHAAQPDTRTCGMVSQREPDRSALELFAEELRGPRARRDPGMTWPRRSTIRPRWSRWWRACTASRRPTSPSAVTRH